MCKKIFALAAAAALILTMGGCGIDEIRDRLQSGGRSSGNTHTATAPETQTNSFFALKVNDAYMVATLDGYYPQYANGAFLVVDITVENVMDLKTPLPMFITDFLLSWEGCTQPEAAYTKFGDDQLEDEWQMEYGEKVSGKLVFDCPANETEFSLVFQEIWEDEYQGDTYVMNFTADTSTYEYVAPEANGRSSGNTYAHGVGETVQNAFFAMTVNGVEKASQVEGYDSGLSGMDFLIVDITIRNTSQDMMDMYSSDFAVEWGPGEDEWDAGYYKSFADQLDDRWTMTAGESITGKLYFAVPTALDEFNLVYTEVWADSFIGDTYLVQMTAGQGRQV